jgi:hypothetical protein
MEAHEVCVTRIISLYTKRTFEFPGLTILSRTRPCYNAWWRKVTIGLWRNWISLSFNLAILAALPVLPNRPFMLSGARGIGVSCIRSSSAGHSHATPTEGESLRDQERPSTGD